MELLTQANLLIAIAAPIAMIFAINAVLQGAGQRRQLFAAPAPRVPAPVRLDRAAQRLEAANDAHHQRAA
jgi:hypothetical protein